MAKPMAAESGLIPKMNPGLIPPILFGLSLMFGLFALAVGWFSVDTTVEIWEYDPADPEGKGEPCIPLSDGTPLCKIRMDTEMTTTALNTKITPTRLHDFIEASGDGLPSYDQHMGRTGTVMLGVLILHVVALVALVGAVGFYAWTRRNPQRTFGRSIWRFSGLFGAFALVTLIYLALAIPDAAEEDTHDVLEEYRLYFENQGFPSLDPQMLEPDVRFWNTWTCCPPDSHFPRSGNEYLVVVTTQSRPSAGFWLEAVNLVLATGALALATNAGQLDAKPPAAPPKNQATPPAPSAPSTRSE